MKKIEDEMKRKGIDRDLTRSILERYNRGDYDGVQPVTVSDIPGVDGKKVLDLRSEITWRADPNELSSRAAALNITMPEASRETDDEGMIVLNRDDLKAIGIRLYPLVAYGILNGGSATSYADEKKNRGFSEELYRLYEKPLKEQGKKAKGQPKGVTPAYTNPDGTPGYSFLELKLRNLALKAREFETLYGQPERPLFPLFQMTSGATDAPVSRAFSQYRKSEALEGLPAEREILTAVQPLIAAFTHSETGSKKEIFTEANGDKNSPLALPGGHGQNFMVLKEIYRELSNRGYRYAYLGNVDNLGNTVDPVSLAILALSGKQAGFDFSFKTPVDVKGGVLIKDQNDRLNCADIGPAISSEEVKKAEDAGKPILFNCATGLFDLKYLADNIDTIIEKLPMRFTDQDKDAGRYSQAEQVTWEIIGILDDFLIFGVDKFSRFLAAKLLTENLLTSGLGLENPLFPDQLKELSENLHGGFKTLMKEELEFDLCENKWVPRNN